MGINVNIFGKGEVTIYCIDDFLVNDTYPI